MSAHGLPTRDAVIDLLASEGRAIHAREIATKLSVADKAFSDFRALLDEMAFDDAIVQQGGQRFRVRREQAQRRTTESIGVMSVHPRGFGFVSVSGSTEDVFVPAEAMGGALHGDTIAVRVSARTRRGLEGVVERVIDRRVKRVAGTLRKRGKSLWLEPDDMRLRGPIVLRGEEKSAADGLACVVSITRYPETPDENPEGEIESVLGEVGDPNVEVAKILVRESIEEAHPPEAVAEAEAFGNEIDPEACKGREDLTGIPLPTIDPEDARDHDDAVWVTRAEDGSYRAWIAIADVSHYVTPGTALDENALARGNSLYFPDRAIPMLPRNLSSNICSLLPGVLRLCMCVIVDLDATGAVRSSRVVEGFMRSAAKLTYPGVARALGFSREPARSEEAEAMRDDLQVVADLSKLLRAKRMRRGALDFDVPEAKVVLDATTGAPIGVEKRTRDAGIAKAYQMIEELMLLANETIATFLIEHNLPAVFRVHGPPDEQKLQRFATMCEHLGLVFDIDDATDPKRLTAFLKKVAEHKQKQVLHMLLLRAMKQAVYDVVNIGHFGLASSAYLHFTSPIRRYPDLVVHRLMRASLRKEKVDRSEVAEERLRVAAATASSRERRGMEVEREVVDLYRALFMRSHLGETLEGTVTGMVGSGIFVALDDPFVDVLVRTESLGRDSYNMDDDGLFFVGARSGDRIALGDRMLVAIEDVSITRRTVYGRRIATAALSADQGEGAKPTRREPRPEGSDRKKRVKRSERSAAPSAKPREGKRPSKKAKLKAKLKAKAKAKGAPKKARKR